MTTLPALSPDENAHTHHVPPVLHQIWIGSPPPPHVLRNWEAWEDFIDRHDPDHRWIVHHWTDETLQDHPLLRAVVGHYAPPFGTHRQYDHPNASHDRPDPYGPRTPGPMSWRGTSDMLRLWLVHLFGGVYMDCDTLPLRDLHTLADRTAWIGEAAHNEHTKNRTVIWNGGFGMPAHHPFSTAVLLHADAQLARGVRDDHHVAGPRAFRQVLNRLPHTRRPEVIRTFGLEPPAAVNRMVKGDHLEIDWTGLRELFPEPIAVIHP